MTDAVSEYNGSTSGWSYSWQGVVSFLDGQFAALDKMAPEIANTILSAADSSFALFGAGVALDSVSKVTSGGRRDGS